MMNPFDEWDSGSRMERIGYCFLVLALALVVFLIWYAWSLELGTRTGLLIGLIILVFTGVGFLGSGVGVKQVAFSRWQKCKGSDEEEHF